MENFWNLNMLSQNKNEDLNQWIGGEYYIQTSLYNIIKKNDNFKIIEIDNISESILYEYLDKANKIFLPGWHVIPDNFKKFKNKLLSYVFFEYSSDELDDLQFITPWKYTNKNSFIPITPIELPFLDYSYEPSFNNCIEDGLLIGKCISHVVSKNKYKELIGLIDLLPIKVFSTFRILENNNIPNYLNNYKNTCIDYTNYIINHHNINHIGIVNPIDFRLLLRKVKFVIFFNSAFAPPTLIEALYEKCIIISTINVIPQDLHNNNNIYLIDNLSTEQITKLINDIHNNIIIFNEEKHPHEYSDNLKLNIIK